MTGQPGCQRQNSSGPSEVASERSLQPDTTLDQPAQQITRSRSRSNAAKEPTSMPEEPKPENMATKKEFDWAGSWIWEIASATLSIVCIALLIGFLAYMNKAPYSNWQYQASPNTVVSIIATVAKAAMLVPVSSCISQLKWTQYQTPKPLYHIYVLDQASRGPWGALEVLWTFKPNLATAGAIVMILSLAIDPFAQQILTYPSHSVLAANETAFVQMTREYPPGDSSRVPELTASMHIAILNGLSETNRPLEPACTSEDCRYPDFVSLGICSRCENITSQVNQTCVPIPGFVQPQSIFFAYQDTPVNCTYTTPHGLQYVPRNVLSALDDGRGNGSIMLSRDKWTVVSESGTYSGEIFGISRPIVSALEVKYAYAGDLIYTPNNATEPEQKPQMVECAVYFCEKQYTQNRFSLHYRQVHPTRTQPLVVGPASNSMSLPLIPLPRTKTLSSNSTYMIDIVSLEGLEEEIAAILTISRTRDLHINYGKVPMSSILESRSDLNESLRSMSTSVTDAIRSNAKSVEVPGQAFRTTTFVYVRWPWIILPIAVVVISTLLLIATIITNRKLRVVMWKSSIFGLLICQLETRPEHDMKPLRNVDETQLMSKKIEVMMKEDQNSIKFVEH